ncbi:MAG: trehalose-phosphatase [Hymenobacter sp.]
MPEDEQVQRMAAMQALVKRYNIFAWTRLFLNQLAYTKMKQHTLATEMLTEEVTEQLLTDYHAADERMLLLDYDGTLMPFQADPQRVEPGQELRLLLRALTDLPHTRVVIISGRDRHTLEKWLGRLAS